MKCFCLAENELNNGITTCFDKVKRLLDDAELLVRNEGNLSNALGLYTFAVEEHGKGLLLKECQRNRNGNYEVPISIFGRGDKQSHDNKIQKALSNLPVDCKNLSINIKVKTASDSVQIIKLKSGKEIFSIAPNTTGDFSTVGVDTVEEDTRWRCFYVDWDDNNKYWKYEFEPDKDQLLNAISRFRANIK
jgi:AbiV family abortive infection protein